MKGILKFNSLLILGLVLSSCNKPPSSSHLRLDDAKPSQDLAGTVSTSGYTKLMCEMPETRRGIRAWRRLSNQELINTAKDVFGVTDAVDFSSLNSDIPKIGLYDTVQSPETYMDANRIKGYETFALAVANAADMNKLFPCITAGESCISQKIPEIGAMAWRRPLTPDDIKIYVDLYKTLIADGGTPAGALPYVLEALILSPNFMYRSELGEVNANKEFELTSWEMASALSYLIWRRPPDAPLREAAQNNLLKSKDAIVAQAKRLFADPKAKDAMKDFGDMWFDGKNIVAVVKADMRFNTAAKVAMQNEVRDFVANLMTDPDKGTFDELLNASSTPGTATTSFIYGAMPGADGKIQYAQEQRRGILGQAGFLAGHAFSDTPNPITRGAFVSKRLLCADFAVVKAMEVPEAKPGLSNKERFAAHSSHPACAVCHVMIDPFGFAMENFDSNGLFRTTDADKPIVVESKFMLDGKEVSINKPQDLSKAIASSEQGLNCLARQVFRYSYGRMEFVPRMLVGGLAANDQSVQRKLDQCELDTVTAELKANGGKLQNAMISMISSPAFRLRLQGELPMTTTSLQFTGGSH